MLTDAQKVQQKLYMYIYRKMVDDCRKLSSFKCFEHALNICCGDYLIENLQLHLPDDIHSIYRWRINLRCAFMTTQLDMASFFLVVNIYKGQATRSAYIYIYMYCVCGVAFHPIHQKTLSLGTRNSQTVYLCHSLYCCNV